MRVYIAGPMRGIERWNFPAFAEAARAWREAGHTVITPAEIDLALGMEPDKPEMATPEATRLCMRVDIDVLFSVDAIALLPGWEGSAGCTAELALAMFLRLKVFDAETRLEIRPQLHHWSAS